MSKQQRIKKPMQALVIMYLAFILIRFILACISSAYPLINIDEFLYYGIARSIAEGKGLMFRGQPADYSYILYSLFLSPIYLIGADGPLLFRTLQLWNILAISSSVFPIYFLAKNLMNDNQKALIVSGISMLLPDFMLGQLMMCENLIFPLFFTLLYAFYRYLETKSYRYIMIIGTIGGLLFSIKPGAVIPAAVILMFLLVRGLRIKAYRESITALVGAAVTIGISAFFFGIVLILGGKPSVLSIYQNQVDDASHLDVFFRFIGIYLLYFMLAGGVSCSAIALSKSKHYSFNLKYLFHVLTVSFVTLIIGVSWAVNRYEYNANTAHLRYIGMYLPAFFLLAAVPCSEKEKNDRKKSNVVIIMPYIFTAVLLLVLGIYAGVNQFSVFAENMTLAILIALFKAHFSSLVLTALIFVALLALAYVCYKRKKNWIKTVTIVFVLIMIINTVVAYSISYNATQFDRAKQAKELRTYMPEDESEIYLYTGETITGYYGAFDAYSRRGISYASLNSMFNQQLYATHGVYKPFFPDRQRGSIIMNETPDTNTIVMDATVYAMLKLSKNTQHYSLDEDGLHIVKIIDPLKPWLEYVVGNTKNTELKAGDKGILLIFSEQYLQAPLRIIMDIYSEKEVELSFYSNKERKTLSIMPGRKSYELQFDRPCDAYNFEAPEGKIRFYHFELQN